MKDPKLRKPAGLTAGHTAMRWQHQRVEALAQSPRGCFPAPPPSPWQQGGSGTHTSSPTQSMAPWGLGYLGVASSASSPSGFTAIWFQLHCDLPPPRPVGAPTGTCSAGSPGKAQQPALSAPLASRQRRPCFLGPEGPTDLARVPDQGPRV